MTQFEVELLRALQLLLLDQLLLHALLLAKFVDSGGDAAAAAGARLAIDRLELAQHTQRWRLLATRPKATRLLLAGVGGGGHLVGGGDRLWFLQRCSWRNRQLRWTRNFVLGTFGSTVLKVRGVTIGATLSIVVVQLVHLPLDHFAVIVVLVADHRRPKLVARCLRCQILL